MTNIICKCSPHDEVELETLHRVAHQLMQQKFPVTEIALDCRESTVTVTLSWHNDAAAHEVLKATSRLLLAMRGYHGKIFAYGMRAYFQTYIWPRQAAWYARRKSEQAHE